MWNDETWKPWAQQDLHYRPVHRSTAPTPQQYTFFSSSQNPPSSFHPYGRRTDRVPPYPKITYFNEINPNIPAQRNPVKRSDSWIPRSLPPSSSVVPFKTPRGESWKDFGVPAKSVEVILYASKGAKECSVQWQKPALTSQYTQLHVIKIFERGKLLDTVEIDGNSSKYTFETIPGEFYDAEYCAKDAKGNIIAEGKIQFRATFSKDEMRQLLKKAVNYISQSRSPMHPFRVLYRCKPKCYWDDIQVRTENIMRKYIKDENGQAANPTNGNIFGLFFSARLLPNGKLPLSSPFGNIRMMLPAKTLLDPKRVNMYFSDFYCNKKTHYVTIIICVKNTQSDKYCMEKLIPIAPSNPFIKIVPGDDGYEFYVNKIVWVEIYFTENVPLCWGKFDRVIATGFGTSRIGGLPHNKSCTECNLYPFGNKEAYVNEEAYDEEDDDNEIIAQQNLDKMIASMHDCELPTQDCEDIVFLVNDLVDHVVYDTEVNYTDNDDDVEDQTERNNRPKKKGFASKIRNFRGAVSKRFDRVQSAIVKKKNEIQKKFRK